MIEFSLPGILSDLYNNLKLDVSWRGHVDEFSGTKDFHFASDSALANPLHLYLKNEIDQVLKLNYPELDYRVDGFLSSEYGCMIHVNHRPELPKARKVFGAENHLCLCNFTHNTLDIALSYTNKEEEILGKSARILQTSIILILIILSAFGFSLYTISKQKKLSDLKKDFINNLTHEFKTPIFSISLAAKSLKNHESVHSSSKMNSYVDLIDSESKRLQTQVDKILQMALLDSGNLTLNKRELDIHDCILSVVDRFGIVMSQRSGKIDLKLEATNRVIRADEIHVNNILYNLIDNAVKYSEGPPTIEVSTANSQNGIILRVKDEGIGIDRKVQKYVFDQFYRAEQGDVHTVKGFGLGLSYVKRIIDFHKGNISLKSDLGKGTEFSIFLPVIS